MVYILELVHACLLGEWVNLHDDPDCVIGDNRVNPSQWWEEDAELYYPNVRSKEHTLYDQPYVKIYYKGIDYRIHPHFIQIVTKSNF